MLIESFVGVDNELVEVFWAELEVRGRDKVSNQITAISRIRVVIRTINVLILYA
jgi:hypothetical protein